MDTPGWLGRNLEDFPRVLNALSLDMKEHKPFPTVLPVEILYPSDFTPNNSPEQIQAMKDFLSDITAATDSTWRSVSIKDDWRRTAPVDEKDLNQYLYYVRLSFSSYISRWLRLRQQATAGFMLPTIPSINSDMTMKNLTVIVRL